MLSVRELTHANVGLIFQMFLRDGKQAEVLLSQQDNFLSKEEVPVCSLTIFVIIVILLLLSIFLEFRVHKRFLLSCCQTSNLLKKQRNVYKKGKCAFKKCYSYIVRFFLYNIN